MQSLVLSHSPLNTGHFGQIGFNPKTLSLNLDRPANAEGRSLRDTPSSYFMSSRPTVDDPLKTFKASRQPESAEPRAATTGSVSEPGVSQISATAGVHSSQSMLALREPVLPPQNLLIFDRHGAPQSMEPAYVPSTSSLTASAHAAIRAIAQRPTRRAKAHVASACVNCKKKHLGCDSARPCRRCVLSGKASTCVDVTHKKRGRPPLRAEETSMRHHETSADNTTASAGLRQATTTSPSTTATSSQPRRVHSHRATSSREIRPMTDLQTPYEGFGNDSQRWSFPFSPSRARGYAPLSPVRHGERPFSSGGLPRHMPPATVTTAGSLVRSPPNMTLTSPPDTVVGPRRQPYSYPGPIPIPQIASQSQYEHPPVGGPLSPYPDRNRASVPTSWPSMNRSTLPLPRDRGASYPESPVRLPPILPALSSTGPGPSPNAGFVPRFSDPYPGPRWSWSSRGSDIFGREDQNQSQGHVQSRPPSQVGAVESVSPRTQLTQSQTYDMRHASGDPRSRHSVAISPLTVPIDLGQRLAAVTGTGSGSGEPAKPETEDNDGSRPKKRQKMSLDDIVND